MIPTGPPYDNMLDLSMIWVTRSESGPFDLASEFGIQKASSSVSGYLAEWLPRDVLAASFYAYSQRRVFVSDDPMISAVCAVKMKNGCLASVLYVKQYCRERDTDRYIVSDLYEASLGSHDVCSLARCDIQFFPVKEDFICKLRIKAGDRTRIEDYSYALIPCKNLYMLYKSKTGPICSDTNMDFPNYLYYYIVPLKCILDVTRLSSASRTGHAVGRIE
jgi:hypothetical protein